MKSKRLEDKKQIKSKFKKILFVIFLTSPFFFSFGNMLIDQMSLIGKIHLPRNDSYLIENKPKSSLTISDILLESEFEGGIGTIPEGFITEDTFSETDAINSLWSHCHRQGFIATIVSPTNFHVYPGEYTNINRNIPISQGYNHHIKINYRDAMSRNIFENPVFENVFEFFFRLNNNDIIREIIDSTYDTYDGPFDIYETYNYISNSDVLSMEMGMGAIKSQSCVGSSWWTHAQWDYILIEKWEPNIVCSNIYRTELWYEGVPTSLWLNLTNVGVDTLYSNEDFSVKIWQKGNPLHTFDYFIDVPYDIAPEEDFQVEVPFIPYETGDFWFYVDVDINNDVKELGEETDTSSDDVRFHSDIIPVEEPFVKWENPSDIEHILFNAGDDSWFNFTYDKIGINNVNLTIEGYDYGSVWNLNQVNISYLEHNLEGLVSATLHGYSNDVELVNDTRIFRFGKVKEYISTLLEHNFTYMGDQLYLILHDPPGDHSFSKFKESTTDLSIGVDFDFHTDNEDWDYGFEITPSYAGFSIGSVGTRLEFHESNETIEEFDFRLQVTNYTSLSSNIESVNPNYIGLGRGDVYWGEAWTVRYDIIECNRSFYNGTIEHLKYQIKYWITAEGEKILHHQNAPDLWKLQNQVYNGFQNVSWLKQDFGWDAQIAWEESTKQINTERKTSTIEWQMSQSMRQKLFTNEFETPFVSGHTKVYSETQFNHEMEAYYKLEDDDVSDHLHMDVGIDRLFGTYIFRSNENFTMTSNPLEFNSTDYVSPLITDLSYQYDTTGDGLICSDDNPLITVTLDEETSIDRVWVSYSYDDISDYIELQRISWIDNTFIYEGNLPSIPHGSTMEWYIQAWDIGNHHSIKRDIGDQPYSYTVENKAPEIQLLYPNGGEIIADSVLINWSATDIDNDNLTFSLYYNIENTGWHLIESGIKQQNYTWDFSMLSNSHSIVIRVNVDDGFGGLNLDESDFSFSIYPDPITGTIMINNGDTYCTSSSIALSITSSNAVQMRFSDDNNTDWSSWEPFNSLKQYIFSSNNGLKTIYVQFQDSNGFISANTISDSIILDTIEPTGSIKINNDESSTKVKDVILTLNASDINLVVQMRFSYDGTFWSDWESFEETIIYSLSEGDGLKRIYVQYMDSARLVSDIYYDEILLKSTNNQQNISLGPWIIVMTLISLIYGIHLIYKKKRYRLT